MTRTAAAALALVVAATLAGCGGQDESAAPSDPPSSPAASEPAASPPATDAAPGSSAPSSPGTTGEPSAAAPAFSFDAAPATGPELVGPPVTLRVPEGYRDSGLVDEDGGTTSADDPRFRVTISTTAGGGSTADEKADLALRATIFDPPPTREPNITVAGIEAYHLTGEDRAFRGWFDEFGFDVGGRSVRIQVNMPVDTPLAERTANWQSILASMTVADR